jgi:hypothetical protein
VGYGTVIRRQAGDLVAFAWRENGGVVEWGSYNTPDQALAGFVQDYKAERPRQRKGV